MQVCLNMCEQKGSSKNITSKFAAKVTGKNNEEVLKSWIEPQQTEAYEIFVRKHIEILSSYNIIFWEGVNNKNTRTTSMTSFWCFYC